MSITSDNFNGIVATSDLVGRTASGGGTWAGDTGVFVGGTDNILNLATSGRGQAQVGTPTGTDYSVQADIFAINTFNSLGLLLRVQNSGTYIGLFWNSANWQIRRRDNGSGDTVVADGSAGVKNPSTTRNVKFTGTGVSGDSGHIILTAIDTSDSTLLVSGVLNNTLYDSKGQPGVYFINTTTGGNSTIDNWQADDVGGTILTLNSLTLLGVGKNA